MTRPLDFTPAALAAAEHGWYVFPLRAGDKRPALHGEDRCPRTDVCAEGHLGWEPRATTDPARIHACWATGPFNVGIACGPSRLVVVDLDTPKHPDDTPPPEAAGKGVADGMDVFAALCEQHGQPFPANTYGVRTRRGGWHLYFTAPTSVELRNTTGDSGRGLGWHIDTRAAGGYVIAAGSTVAPGAYTVMHDGEVAPLPDWLTALLAPKPASTPHAPAASISALRGRPCAYTSAALEREIANVLAARPGTRNHDLYNAAYALGRHVGDGRLPRDLAANALHAAGEQIGLPGYEILSAVRGGLERGARDPKRDRRMTTPRRPETSAAEILAQLGAEERLAALDQEPGPEPWDDPIPLGGTRTLPPFPTDALPGWLSAMVDAVAEETQTPADLPGCIALAVLATAGGGRATVNIRARWREPLNLYLAVALPPANRKSAVFSLMTNPLLHAERVLADAAGSRIAEAETTARVARAAAEKAAAKAAGCSDPTERANITAEAIALAQAAESATIPSRPQLVADDATPEAVASLLAEQGGRLSVLSAEGGIFDIIAGRYSGGTPNMEVFLKGHAGDLLKVNRQSRREYIEHPALTMGLALQPAVLEDIARTKGFDGRGLLARFLYSLPESLVGRRKILTTPIPEHVADTYERNITTLTLTLADWTDPAVLPLTPQADALMATYQQQTEDRLARGGSLAHISNWAGKHPGATARIAGLLHLATHHTDGWSRPISADTMTAAMRLGEYFAAHALVVFDAMGADTTHKGARLVLAWLRANPTPQIARRELFTKLPRAEFPTVPDLEPALDLLEEHGWLRRLAPPTPSARGGRPRAPHYLTHPALYDPEA